MKRKFIGVFATFFVQIILFLSINYFNVGLIAVNDPFFIYLFLPIIVSAIIFLLLLLFFILASHQVIQKIELIFQKNKLILYLGLFLAGILLFSSASFFIVADSFLPEVYKSLLPFGLLGYVLGWELLISLSFIREEFNRKSRFWFGLPILIAANYFLWHDLVVVGRYLDEFLPNVYPGQAEIVLTNYHWWELLLPIREFQGMWQFELIIVYLLENIIGISGVWHLFQLILILIAFFLSWKVFRSTIFSYILVMCLVFGTHLYHAFQYSSITAFYLLQAVFILFLYLAYRFIKQEKRKASLLIGIVLTLSLAAIMYEGWLDFFAGIWLVTGFLIVYFRKNEKFQFMQRSAIIFGILNIIFLIYMLIKFTYLPFPHTSGESAMVFSYPRGSFWRGLEDIVSNYFKYLYMTLTNFLPPELIFSNALYQYEELQTHSNSVIVYNYLLYWRYFAGVAVTLFYSFFIKILKKICNSKSTDYLFLPLLIFLAMTAVNGATHTLLMFRPTRLFPHAGYHVYQGILGFSLSIAYGVDLASKRIKNNAIIPILIGMFTIILLYSAIRRPNYLWHIVEMAGIDHQGPYPNPLAVLIIKIRRIFPGFLL